MTLRKSIRLLSVGLLVTGLLSVLAIDSIVMAGKAEDAKKYTEQLKTSKDAKKRAEAVDELGKLGQIMKSLVEPAIPEIKKALEDKDAIVRAKAAEAYGKLDLDSGEVVPALVKILKNEKEEESVRIGAAHGLAAMGDKAKSAAKDLQQVKKAEDKSKLGKAATDAMRSINVKKN